MRSHHGVLKHSWRDYRPHKLLALELTGVDPG
jgi:hypothetical protein